jgi:hypothetical protein
MMYLLTAGSTSNKLATLAIACQHRDTPAGLRGAVRALGPPDPAFLVVAVAGVKVAAFLQSTAKRLGGLSVAEVLRRPNDPFVLYLRPFDTDDVILPTPRLPPLSSFLFLSPFSGPYRGGAVRRRRRLSAVDRSRQAGRLEGVAWGPRVPDLPRRFGVAGLRGAEDSRCWSASCCC